MRTFGLALASAGALLAAAAPALAAPVLEKVVLVARHGVRAPTATTQALSAETGVAWPAWSVGAGQLTAHGRAALAVMGEGLRATYAAAGVLPASDCATGAAEVWADGEDERTRDSAEVLARALSPACPLAADHGPPGAPDALFHAVAAGACPVDPAEALRSAKAEAEASGGLVRPKERAALDALQRVISPDGCSSHGVCLAGESRLVMGQGGAKIEGPLGQAASWSENLLLEYAEGFAATDVGWGRAGSVEAIASVMPVHDRQDELLRQAAYPATHNAAVLAPVILDLLQDRRPVERGAPPLSPDARLVLLVGHDTNLSNLAGVFGLRWTLPGQPDPTAPDTVLAFERWRDAPGAKPRLRVVVFSQTLEALRTLSADTRTTQLTPAVCISANRCPLTQAAARVRASLPAACRP